MKRFAFLLVLALCAGSLAATPVSAQSGATDPNAAGAADDEADETAAWTKQLDDARAHLRGATERLRGLEDAKGRGAARRYPRGDAKAEYLAQLAEARADLADARRSYPEVVEEARRAGMPPGLLSDYEEEAEAAAAAADAADDDGAYEAENTDLSEYEAENTDDAEASDPADD